MSAATLATLRAMMRDEIKHGMLEMEHGFTNKLDRAISDMKAELKVETAARRQLEETYPSPRTNFVETEQPHNGCRQEVDKAVAVLGGFVETYGKTEF